MEYALFLIHIVSYDLDVTPLPRVLKQEMPGYEAAFVLRNRYRGNVKHSAALSSSLSQVVTLTVGLLCEVNSLYTINFANLGNLAVLWMDIAYEPA